MPPDMAQTTEAELARPAAASVDTPAASEPSDANKRSAAQALAVDASFKRYGIDRWGRDFVRANEQGQLVFSAPNSPPVDLHALSQELARRGIRTPYVVRFPTMIENQMRQLKEAFHKAIDAIQSDFPEQLA